MTPALERRLIRWMLLILSVPVLGYIYGPIENRLYATEAVKWVFLPAIVISGLWLWKGHWIKKKLKTQGKKLLFR
ncbi:hypothetical protein [Mucilaginibacter sp. FT3.2]|uniref:hypothetical protein n=1 Tax=Mucilaginibacter sp. FT3.2 TaxID=2723090 RepID=UPI00160F6130|nr:hypothetical protein [Mucilaginibacter sp. FT3.2]MBB6233208.1 putative membrane protein YpjA [Mucilaginibacter sp. FT3.2]